MLALDKDGMVQDPRVRAARQATIERGDMAKVSGIIVHQTGGQQLLRRCPATRTPVLRARTFSSTETARFIRPHRCTKRLGTSAN